MCTLYEYVQMNINNTVCQNLEMTWSYCQYKSMGWNPDLCQWGEWGGVLNRVSEDVRMGWFPDLCQWGGWDGAMTRIREDWDVPWTESMRRMEWCPDLCQWREWGCLLNYVNEEMRWCPDLNKWNQALTRCRRTQEALHSQTKWVCGSNWIYYVQPDTPAKELPSQNLVIMLIVFLKAFLLLRCLRKGPLPRYVTKLKFKHVFRYL